MMTFLGARIYADANFLGDLLENAMSLSHQICMQQLPKKTVRGKLAQHLSRH